MALEWVVKSESDTDKVWAEVNDNGEETGNYRYEFSDQSVLDISPPKSKIVDKKQVALMGVAATLGAGIVVIARALGA